MWLSSGFPELGYSFPSNRAKRRTLSPDSFPSWIKRYRLKAIHLWNRENTFCVWESSMAIGELRKLTALGPMPLRSGWSTFLHSGFHISIVRASPIPCWCIVLFLWSSYNLVLSFFSFEARSQPHWFIQFLLLSQMPSIMLILTKKEYDALPLNSNKKGSMMHFHWIFVQ